MWTTKKDFEAAANRIAQAFVANPQAATINDQAVKIAEAAQLNPDSVRTLVRLTNVAVFEQLFEKAGTDQADDRMFVFDVGDAEQVLNRLHQQTQETLRTKEAAAHYDPLTDFFSDVPRAVEFEKVAEPQPVVPTPESTPDTGTTQPAMIRQKFRRVSEKMAEQQRQAQMEWYLTAEKVARMLVAEDSRKSHRTQFEKDAVAQLGETIIPELRLVQELTGANADEPLWGGMKLATVLDTHISSTPAETPILRAVKEASEARLYSTRLGKGLQWIEKTIFG